MIRRADSYGAPNTIDQLKLLALITMTIDHIGYFLFPDILLLRVIGRVSFPLWLFVVGFHAAAQPARDWKRIKHSTPVLLLGSIVIALSNFIVSKPIFPISILLTILSARILLTLPIIRNTIERQPLTVLIYAFLALPVFPLTEYGSLGLMFALLGFLVRKGAHKEAVIINAGVAFASYMLFTEITFNLWEFEEYLLIILLCITLYGMTRFTFKPWAPVFAKPICLITRNSYYYYIAHVLLLKAFGTLFYRPAHFFLLKFFS